MFSRNIFDGDEATWVVAGAPEGKALNCPLSDGQMTFLRGLRVVPFVGKVPYTKEETLTHPPAVILAASDGRLGVHLRSEVNNFEN